MKRVLAVALIIPAALTVAAAPASAAPPSKAICNKLFHTPDQHTTYGTSVYVLPGEMDGSSMLIGKYGAIGGTLTKVSSCLIYDANGNGKLDPKELTFAARDVLDLRDEEPPYDSATSVFSISFTGVPEDGQLCHRTRYQVTDWSGVTTTMTDATRCFSRDATELPS